MFILSVSSISLVAHQLHGKPAWLIVPIEKHFGWPIPYMRCPDSITLPANPKFFLGFYHDDWVFLTPIKCEFSWFALAADIAISSAILFGVAACVELFCRAHDLRLRFSFVGLFAIVGWIATVFTMTNPSVVLEHFYTVLVEQFLYGVLGFAWFGWTTIFFRIATRWCSSFRPRST